MFKHRYAAIVALSCSPLISAQAAEVSVGMEHTESLPYQQQLTAHTTAINATIQGITNSMKTCGNAGMVYAPGATGANSNGCIDLPITKCAKAGKDYHPTAAGADSGGCIARGIPENTVAAFNLSACPSGWKPMASLEGRVIIGVGDLGDETYNLRSAGGAAMRKLSAANLPRHRHSIEGGVGSMVYEAKSDSHATIHALNPFYNRFGEASYVKRTTYTPEDASDQTEFDNRQPYLALRYCYKD